MRDDERKWAERGAAFDEPLPPLREPGEQGLNDVELELVKLRNQVRRLETPVCCPSCGTEIERKAS